jgi:hypothetical protein
MPLNAERINAMTRIYALLSLLLLIGCAPGCGGLLKNLFTDDTTEEIPTECVESYFSEDFEKYELGIFPNRHPWKYHADDRGFIDVTVTDTDFVSGSRSIKAKMTRGDFGGSYASLRAYGGCNRDDIPVYIQYRVKYLGEDSYIRTEVKSFGTYVIYHISLKSGLKVNTVETDPETRWHTLYESGSIQPDRWYRFEIMLNDPEPQDYSLKVYEGESLTELSGRIDYGDLSADRSINTNENFEGHVEFQDTSQNLIDNPDRDMSQLGFYLDDFAVSDDPSILKVGF